MKMLDFFNPKSPPVIVGDSPPAPLMASSSGVSYAANDINDDDERLSLSLSLFPTLSCADIRESSSSSVGDNNGSNQDRETRITRAERERSLRRVVPRKSKQPVPRREEEENHSPGGVSTELVLYEDPWKIKKKLKRSDVGNLSRLLLPQDCVETHVLRGMGEETVSRVESEEGMGVAVRDADTGDERRLVFHRWVLSSSYVLNGEWNKGFVRRRGLEVDDEIGMVWDANACMFHFKVLRKAAAV